MLLLLTKICLQKGEHFQFSLQITIIYPQILKYIILLNPLMFADLPMLIYL